MTQRPTTRTLLALLAGAGALFCVFLLLRAARTPDDARARIAPGPDASAGAAELDAPPAGGEDALVRAEEERTVLESTAPAAQLVIAIRDEAGTPLPGTRAIAFRSDGLLWSELADDRGEIAVPVLAEPAEVVCMPRGAVPARRELPAGEARCEIALPEGVEVAGRLLVDGGPPSEPVRLVLVSDHPILDLEGIPPDVRALLESSPGAPLVVADTTGAGGRFRFRGLAEHWSGFLYFPVEYIPVRAQPEGRIERFLVRLDRAVASLTIETTHLPMLTGRLVEAGSMTSAVGVGQTVMLRKQGDDTTTVVEPTDQEGRFRVPILEPGFLRAEQYIREELGVHRLDDLAAEDLRVEARLGGQSYTIQHDARVLACELRVPVHGSIDVRLEPGLEWGDDERAVVVLVSLAEGRGEPRGIRIDRATTELDLGPLLPGDYTLCVERIATRDGAERRVELSRKQSAQVRAHETTTVVLGP